MLESEERLHLYLANRLKGERKVPEAERWGISTQWAVPGCQCWAQGFSHKGGRPTQGRGNRMENFQTGNCPQLVVGVVLCTVVLSQLQLQSFNVSLKTKLIINNSVVKESKAPSATPVLF